MVEFACPSAFYPPKEVTAIPADDDSGVDDEPRESKRGSKGGVARKGDAGGNGKDGGGNPEGGGGSAEGGTGEEGSRVDEEGAEEKAEKEEERKRKEDWYPWKPVYPLLPKPSKDAPPRGDPASGSARDPDAREDGDLTDVVIIDHGDEYHFDEKMDDRRLQSLKEELKRERGRGGRDDRGGPPGQGRDLMPDEEVVWEERGRKRQGAKAHPEAEGEMETEGGEARGPDGAAGASGGGSYAKGRETPKEPAGEQGEVEERPCWERDGHTGEVDEGDDGEGDTGSATEGHRSGIEAGGRSAAHRRSSHYVPRGPPVARGVHGRREGGDDAGPHRRDTPTVPPSMRHRRKVNPKVSPKTIPPSLGVKIVKCPACGAEVNTSVSSYCYKCGKTVTE